MSTSAYALQEPDFLASATAARPAGVMAPAFISLASRALLVADQALFGLRGVNICMWKRSSIDFMRLSIHPKQSASSTASSYDNVGRPVCFFANTSQTPCDEA